MTSGVKVAYSSGAARHALLAEWHRIGGRRRHFRGKCKLKLFVYESLFQLMQATLNVGYLWGEHANCLAGGCTFSEFGHLNTVQYSSEIPAFFSLIEACQVTTVAAEADAFLVPIFYGTLVTSGWMKREMPADMRETQAMLVKWMKAPEFGRNATTPSLLPHLTKATSRKHVLFQSMDSHWVFFPETTLAGAIVVNLGDDDLRGPPWDPGSRPATGRSTRRFRSLTIPYRLSQWRVPAPDLDAHASRQHLLSGNVNDKRASIRGELRRSLLNESRALISAAPQDRRHQLAGSLLSLSDRMVSSALEAPHRSPGSCRPLCAPFPCAMLWHRSRITLPRLRRGIQLLAPVSREARSSASAPAATARASRLVSISASCTAAFLCVSMGGAATRRAATRRVRAPT